LHSKTRSRRLFLSNLAIKTQISKNKGILKIWKYKNKEKKKKLKMLRNSLLRKQKSGKSTKRKTKKNRRREIWTTKKWLKKEGKKMKS
jgi:hypothetical protein